MVSSYNDLIHSKDDTSYHPVIHSYMHACIIMLIWLIFFDKSVKYDKHDTNLQKRENAIQWTLWLGFCSLSINHCIMHSSVALFRQKFSNLPLRAFMLWFVCIFNDCFIRTCNRKFLASKKFREYMFLLVGSCKGWLTKALLRYTGNN